MFAVRRLIAVGTVLSLAALLASSHLLGQPGSQRAKSIRNSTGLQKPPADGLSEELSVSSFTDQPVVLYRNEQGETLMGLQVKPKLQPIPARPHDYLVLVDTAASMANGHLKTAQTLTKALVKKLGSGDRLALWTINTRVHDLSQGFKSGKELDGALKKLAEEYPAGAVNLKDSLRKAIDSFDGKEDRQRLILFLGSGQGIAGPVDAELRAALCKEMAKNQIALYSVPLGSHLEPYNLHGFANGTGGKLVRLGLEANTDKWLTNLLDALSQPILYGSSIQLPAEVSEAFPTALPPLRPDVPTLVVGKLGKGGERFIATKPTKVGDRIVPGRAADRFEYTVTGKVTGNDVTVKVSENPLPPKAENFFLVNMFEQWKGQKDRPALIQADRALAFASERSQMARADLLAKAEWAMEKKKFDVAERLYRQAVKADPMSVKAKAGLRLVQELRDGKKTLKDVEEMIAFKKGDMVTRIGGGRVVQLPAEELFAQAEPKDKKDERPLAPDEAERNRLNEVRARRAIADQAQTQIVNEAIARANRQVQTDPDAAHESLKRTLDGVLSNPDISAEARAALGNRLQRAVQDIDIRGAVVKRDQAEALSLLASANARTTLSAQQRLEQNNVRERMRVFHALMDQAREQQAYRQANAIRVDLVNQGLPVPPAVTAGYQVGLAGYHLREVQELRRIRQERWLATLLEVEKSHVPFPDEPPVEFPPPAVWKELSIMRKARYESSTFGTDLPARGFELQRNLSQPVRFDGFEDPRITLSEALDQLAKRYDLSFDINEKAFKFENVNDVAKTPITEGSAIPPMHSTLSTVLRRILQRINVPSGATYVIRQDHIEITTGIFAGAEKTVRVYPAADLVTPIPIAVNPQILYQSAAFSQLGFGGAAGVFGIGGIGGLGALGLGALGGLGGLGLAGLGGGLGGVGGIGGLGGFNGIAGAAGIGGIGAQGFNQLGAQGGFQGNFQGRNNLGVGGGIVGFGGGQLGQFGNLGGQFGLQGGNQSQILINLIRQVVGKPKDWAINFDPVTGQALNPLEENPAEGLNVENNQLGFFPPSQALVVKATSTLHARPSNIIVAPGAVAPGMGALPVNGRDRLAAGNRDPKVRVGAGGGERPDDKDRPPLDPKTVWQEALVKGVDNPSLIIATADFLVLANKFDHAAEFLKANLRQGIVVEPWVYKSLAIALRISGGSTEDIERAEVSTADLEPRDAQGYLQAAQALAQDEKYALALAFCRQAALLDPATPHAYSEALGYAELARDAQAMEWAAGNLLRQDWPANNQKVQDRAMQKIESLAKLLNREGRKEEAERLLGIIADRRQRDLVIKLRWQGEADLDLKIFEPTGSICTPLTRQTIGGGVLIGDSLADMTSETYLAAEAFSGEYQIEIEKIWGHPLNDKVQLKIIRHQGTPEESEQLLTVEMKSRYSPRIKVKLDDGRRKETAYVAPPEAQKESEPPPAAPNPDRVLHQLRVLADPEVTGVSRGFSGGMSTSGQPVLPSRIARKDAEPSPDDRTLYQTRVKPFVRNAMDVTAQAVISADRRYVRLSLSPVFNTVTAVQALPVVVNPTIPGVR
jgi:tetratricopeptide (TPR) repeat protein